MKKLVVIFLIIFFGHINLNFAEEAISPEVQNAVNEIENAVNQFNKLAGDKTLSRKTKQKIKQADVIQIQESIEKSRAEIKKQGKKAVPDLEKAILDKEKESSLKNTLIDLLVELGDEEVAGTLIEVAEHKENEQPLRTSALWYTGQLARKIKESNKKIDKKYMKNLEIIFEDEQSNKDLKEKAFAVYGIIGQNDALPVLIKKFDDPRKEIVASVAYAVGEVRTPEGEEALFQGYLKNRGTEVEGLFIHLFKIYKIKKATSYLIEDLRNIKGNSINDSAKRARYIKTLGEIGDTSAMPVLKEIINNSDLTANGLNDAEDAAIELAKMGDYETIKKVIKRIEIDGRGSALRSRNLYKKLTGEDYNY